MATGDGDLLGAVALGLDRVGARFAMPRTDLIAVLEAARVALDGRGTPAEAQVTAALARQLQHSVPADRPRAGPYAERAVAIARRLDDPATLASCLLAQHDTMWTPGTGARRTEIAAEIADAARRAGDPERHAQALLLSATAQLENGSAAFRAAFAEYAYVTGELRQPRHDYLLRTRQAALALLDGDIEGGDRLSREAAAMGEAVGDSDTGNVRMSQRLEIVRARADPDELRRTAAEAVHWWIGAPAHAHAVAAGFLARAGDLAAARREVDTVLALDDWRADRSYLWSVFVGELTAAAIALGDRALCELLLDDLMPLADTCAVNGALVCFMGAHAHRVGLLQAALGDPAQAAQSLYQALDVHRRLGARIWEDESRRALAGLGVPAPTSGATMRRVGDLWQVGYHGRTAYLRDAKGLRDLAVLLARPGTDVTAMELAAEGGRRSWTGSRTSRCWTEPRCGRTGGGWPTSTTSWRTPRPVRTWPGGSEPATSGNGCSPSCATPPGPAAPSARWARPRRNGPAKRSPPGSETLSGGSVPCSRTWAPIWTEAYGPATPAATTANLPPRGTEKASDRRSQREFADQGAGSRSTVGSPAGDCGHMVRVQHHCGRDGAEPAAQGGRRS